MIPVRERDVTSLMPGPKLWVPPDFLEFQAQPTGPTLSPWMKLTEFFEEWFLPVVLIGEENVNEATIQLYRDALGYWVRLIGDPPICKIDEVLLSRFYASLRTATFKRGLRGKEYSLKPGTIHKHLRSLRTIIYRVGPQTDPRRNAKCLIDRVPYIKVGRANFEQRPAFPMKTAIKIAAATPLMDTPKFSHQEWNALLASFYYSGLRSGTIFELRKSMFRELESGWWLFVPASIVPKTEKSAKILCHPQWIQKVKPFLDKIQADDLVHHWRYCDRYFATLHEKLQKKAGIAECNWLSPHAWRRTHGQEMGRLGYNVGMDVARGSLDHSDVRTTAASYVDLQELRLKLPKLFPDEKHDPNQQLLF